jgi:hypothetical protein
MTRQTDSLANLFAGAAGPQADGRALCSKLAISLARNGQLIRR